MDASIVMDSTDSLSIARELIGRAKYQYRSERCNPPRTVNCISLTSWWGSQCGVHIPCSIYDQLYLGTLVRIKDAPAGSLMFCFGRVWNRYDDNRARFGVGHVGIYTGEGAVIHASASHNTVVEQSIGDFLRDSDNFRGVYQIAHFA